MRLVILPQAFRNMIPILLTQTIILFQDTSLVYVISATDFVGAASKIAQRDGRLIEMYLFVAVVYFVICFTLSVHGEALAKKDCRHPLSADRSTENHDDLDATTSPNGMASSRC